MTATAEINRAVAEYASRQAENATADIVQEAVERAVRQRLDEIEAWLRPMLANAGINATAALLASVEVICGTRLGKDRVKEYVDLLRGRAWQLYRRPVRGDDKGEA